MRHLSKERTLERCWACGTIRQAGEKNRRAHLPAARLMPFVMFGVTCNEQHDSRSSISELTLVCPRAAAVVRVAHSVARSLR